MYLSLHQCRSSYNLAYKGTMHPQDWASGFSTQSKNIRM